MAYMDQAKKAKLAPEIKRVLKKYNLKGSISVNHHSSLVVTIKQGDIDFIGNSNKVVAARPGGFRTGNPAKDNISVNPHWFTEHFDGKALKCMTELIAAMNVGNHNNSDIQSDYFDVGHYVDVNIGKWDTPYALVK